jgi:hypothetical protein
MKRIIITLLALATFGGVASADRFHGPTVRDHRTGYVQRPAARYNNYNRTYTYSRPTYRYTRPAVRVVRRPIYVQRPVIAYRYYNYYQRPAIVAENYPARDGYYWVAGQWQWNGYEWIWQAGHYEPDQNYYNNGYYDSGYYHDSGYYPQQSGVSGSVYLNLGN